MPSDFHLFRMLKDFLNDTRFVNDDELKEIIKQWTAKVYEEGILKLVDCYNKCFNVDDNYLERANIKYVVLF